MTSFKAKFAVSLVLMSAFGAQAFANCTDFYPGERERIHTIYMHEALPVPIAGGGAVAGGLVTLGVVGATNPIGWGLIIGGGIAEATFSTIYVVRETQLENLEALASQAGLVANAIPSSTSDVLSDKDSFGQLIKAYGKVKNRVKNLAVDEVAQLLDRGMKDETFCPLNKNGKRSFWSESKIFGWLKKEVK
jgi:hypothetical protein